MMEQSFTIPRAEFAKHLRVLRTLISKYDYPSSFVRFLPRSSPDALIMSSVGRPNSGNAIYAELPIYGWEPHGRFSDGFALTMEDAERIAKIFSKGDLRIIHNPERFLVTVRSSVRGEFVTQTAPAREVSDGLAQLYPRKGDQQVETATITEKELHRALTVTRKAAMEDPTRPHLTGILVLRDRTMVPKASLFVGTDGHRMHIVARKGLDPKAVANSDHHERFANLNQPTVDLLLRILDPSSEASVSIVRVTAVDSDGLTGALRIEKHNGWMVEQGFENSPADNVCDYPPFSRIIPGETTTGCTFTADKGSLVGANEFLLKAVTGAAYRTIECRVNEAKSTLELQPGASVRENMRGVVRDEVPLTSLEQLAPQIGPKKKELPHYTIGVEGGYLLDALTSLPGQQVAVLLHKEQEGPIVLTDLAEVLCIVMPVRL